MDSFVVLTGLSGAGKTTSLHALEDLGYFTVDNVPPKLWPDLVKQVKEHNQSKVVVGIDVRTRDYLDSVLDCLAELRDQGINPTVIFLDAADDVLVKRYNLTRRTHPLGKAPLSDDIVTERNVLGPLRASADLVLDTSRYSAKDLIEVLRGHFGHNERFRLRLMSFGFKRGIPIDADNIFDLRALPNPYYDPALRAIDGRDERVQAYVFQGNTFEFYTQMREFIRVLSQMTEASGRSSYTVAVGCTGGQHRSVAIAERLANDFAEVFSTTIEHRDVELALAEHSPKEENSHA
ncbi:MAG: RNase adapter RapZ [Trueperaceae bacterium]|nr:RNase adapter RapZ [Trueperaceae bacterium]